MREYSTIRLDHDGGVATLSLHRPEVRNAFSDLMAREIVDVMAGLAEDEPGRAVILTRRGDAAVCAGAPL